MIGLRFCFKKWPMPLGDSEHFCVGGLWLLYWNMSFSAGRSSMFHGDEKLFADPTHSSRYFL